MITNWFALRKLSDHFHKQYENAVLDRCYTFEKNELWLEFRNKAPLKVHLGQPFQYAVTGSESMKVNRDTVRIFPSLEGAIVKNVGMLPDERIMTFDLQDGSSLYILFLSNRGNVIYRRNDELEYFKKKVTIDPNMLIGKNIPAYLTLDEDPRFSPYWKRNAFDIFGVDNYLDLLNIINNSNGLEVNDRFVLMETDKAYTPEIFYSHYRGFVVSHLQKDNFHSDHRNIEKLISSKLDDLQRKIRDTKNDGKIEKRAEKYRFYASVLSASRHLIQEHSDTFTVPDMYRTEGFPTEIPLKNDLSLSENIDLYYKKARSAQNSIEENEKRHTALLKEFPIWEELYKELQEIKDSRTLRDWKKANSTILKNSELRTPNSETSKRRPYKEYIKDDWRIWVGRSARDNDELTFKHAAKTDIWLHTRHSTGSHVIIKMDGKKEAPRHIIEHAAALAARFSDEKHSSLVPVAYTLRKYVTKRKGMPPGKVHFQYEKDVMVKPAEI
jgi:predicted ribosome quality control (RQC) complex YloA/Tae2 family protein